jgi:hypothetical protein
LRWISAAFTFGLVMWWHASTPIWARPVGSSVKLDLGAAAPLKLRADRLTYEAARGCPAATDCGSTLELAGAVSLELGELRLRCARARVELGRGGTPARLDAGGGVTVVLGERSGTARSAEVRLDGGRIIVMRGDARLRVPRLGFALAGSRIEVDLGSGKLTVREARLETAVSDGR